MRLSLLRGGRGAQARAKVHRHPGIREQDFRAGRRGHFRRALRQEFIRRGNIKVVPVEEAEAVFRVTIKSINIQPVAHNAVGIVSNRITVENRLFVSLDIRCEEKKTHKTLWSDPSFSYYKIYEVNNASLQTQPIVGFENRESALDFLAQEMSTRIHDRFLSNF